MPISFRAFTKGEDDLAFRTNRIQPGTTLATFPKGNMHWIVLIVAGLFEVGWAVGLKYTEGFTKFWPSVATAVSMIISLGLLGVALKSLPLGTAYAVWVGVGMVGTVIFGIAFFGEPMTLLRTLSVLLILAGVIGLKLAA